MDVAGLSHDIVINRQSRAPRLKSISETCHRLIELMSNIKKTIESLGDSELPELKKMVTQIDNQVIEIQTLLERVGVRYHRFQNGMITVSVAGLEKAGKTSFLKSLTGIDALPTFDERCTAVCCEIHYSEDRSDFDIEFYSETEFFERVLTPVIETITSTISTDQKIGLIPPTSVADFVNLRLPNLNLIPGGTTAYRLLRDLYLLQQYFNECRINLGRPALLGRPLTELREWVSYLKSDPGTMSSDDEKMRGSRLAKISAVKVCRIYTKFKGGSKNLRWIDTPGVDDPNRRARELTLSTIASDTDLLVVASRPGATPSAAESFHNFWDSVSRMPDEIGLMNRLLFVLNWDRRVDPQGENIRIHQKYLMDAGVPQHLFIGPFEAIKPEDASKLMDEVNRHLIRKLPIQDDHVVAEFQNRLKHIQAKLRLLYEDLSKISPSDAGLYELEDEEFHKWFHWYQDDKDTGFWTDLVEALDHAARTISKDPGIQKSENALYSIFAEEAEKIQMKIPTPKDLESFVIKHRGENPIPTGMRAISTYFSKLINRLSGEIQEFGPIMQDELIKVFIKSGLEPILKGNNSSEKLKSLLENFESRNSASPIVDVLKEALELPRNLKYVLRYELRGAVDFCDPTLWDESETAWSRLVDMLVSNGGDPEKLAKFETNRHPPVTDSREKDSDILKKIAGNAMLGIQAVLNNERYLPRRIADDFMRDCRVRLCFAPESEQEWRKLLFANRGVLLAGIMSRIRSKSEKIQAFRIAIQQLEASLP